jgi:hypothetical protein
LVEKRVKKVRLGKKTEKRVYGKRLTGLLLRKE